MNPFEYRKPTDEQVARIQQVRDILNQAYWVTLRVVPDSAMRTLAIRKLEEASMWANKAIVFEGES